MRVLKCLSFVLMIVALIGFYESSSLHLHTILYPEKAVNENWWISWGFFIVLIPAGFALNKLQENTSAKDSEKIVFGSRWITYIVLGYLLMDLFNIYVAG